MCVAWPRTTCAMICTPSPEISMDESYDDFPRIEEAFQQRLDESLNPSGPSSLLNEVERMAEAVEAQNLVDIGCGEGDDAVEIARRLELDVVAVDPVDRHLQIGRESAENSGVASKVTFRQGTAEHLPLDDSSIDMVFAKESLMYADLDAAFAEMFRVLRPGGTGLVYQVFTGPHMSDSEAASFWPMNAGARSVRPEDLERAIESTGLVVTERIDLASQWGEYGFEQNGTPGRRLAHVARLRRDPERYIAEFGQSAYEIMLHDCLWHVYRMLGLLHGAMFTFGKPDRSAV